MFSKWVELEAKFGRKVKWMKRWVPSLPKFKAFHHFNFILLHYLYLIFLIFLCSVVLYGIGGMKYIDALFFAAGASTQSGLNTLDLNTIFLSQQIMLVAVACVANPIFINGMVVFIRLYWFEKRFQHVARDARSWRRTGPRSQSRSEMRADMDPSSEERGLAGREIHSVRSANGDASSATNGIVMKDSDSEASQVNIGSHHQADETLSSHNTESPTLLRNIVFADDVRPRSSKIDNLNRVPQQRTKEENLAFVENQRNPKDGVLLRVPGPRDYDRGEVPHQVAKESIGGNVDHVLGVEDNDGEEDQRVQASGAEKPDELNLNTPNKSRFSDWASNLSTMIRPQRSPNEINDDGSMHLRQRGPSRTLTSFLSSRSQDRADYDPMPYLSYTATIGRNSLFVDLTEDQREELGGVEYRALKTLLWVLTVYYIGFHALGICCLVPWIYRSSYKHIPEAVSQNAGWWGAFTAMSSFTDLGFTVTPDSMISFQTAVFPLLLLSFLIVIGNTGFPCMLRLSIWLFSLCVSHNGALYEELRFLLDHPRRCFTLLFPRQATWWLFGILVLLNFIDIVFFIILDLKATVVTMLPAGVRLLDGTFQAFSTRTAGFAVVNLAALHPGIQVSYLVMMYISVLPIAISIRRTNVYEENSLGIYHTGDDVENDNVEKSYIGSHLRRQLSFDLWYLFLGLFIICIVESDRLQNRNDYDFNIFAVLFEIVSAYGTVGLSLGYPGINASFSTEFRTISKLVIIAMQLRGRHRGLPYALDRAILLPSETLQRKEAEEAARQTAARQPRMSSATEDERASRVSGSRSARAGRTSTTGAQESSQRRETLNFGNGTPAGMLKKIASGALSAGPGRRKSHKDA